MTAFERAGDPVDAARLALHAGVGVEDVGRIYGPPAHRAYRIAALHRLLAERDADGAGRAVARLLASLEREATA